MQKLIESIQIGDIRVKTKDLRQSPIVSVKENLTDLLTIMEFLYSKAKEKKKKNPEIRTLSMLHNLFSWPLSDLKNNVKDSSGLDVFPKYLNYRNKITNTEMKEQSTILNSIKIKRPNDRLISGKDSKYLSRRFGFQPDFD
ncbi:MAG: hypothetical protein Q8M15_17035 [Bacteroidota bacterium]|nr:hypothetical protein [Bacteroidota bacterium]